MEDIQAIKQRFEIIGNNPGLNRAIDIATQVAPTDLSVLITGESGVGKEIFPRIIHAYSTRKHAQYIAVNCGAIPEGTIDSELFGHEKGAFTGAVSDRKGYFEVTDGGTIFLDEVGELPLPTQARLLRVLETGEFIRKITKFYFDFHWEWEHIIGCVINDPLAVAYFLDPDICQGFDSYVQIETEGISLGQSVVDSMDFYRKTPNTKVLTEVDVYAFFQLFLSRILGLEPEKLDILQDLI